MTSFFKLLFVFLYAYFAVRDNEPLFVLNAKTPTNNQNQTNETKQKESCLLRQNWHSLMDLVTQVAEQVTQIAEQELHICDILR